MCFWPPICPSKALFDAFLNVLSIISRCSCGPTPILTLYQDVPVARPPFWQYIALATTCNSCQLRKKCTKAKSGRTLKRHVRQDDLDFMLEKANSRKAKKDIRTRQHLMERSFARGTRYGYKRARWRRLWRVQIQEYLTSSIQNIMILVRHIKEPAPALGMVQTKPGQSRAYLRLQQLFFDFKEVITNSISYLFKFRCSEAQNLAENLWPNLKFRVWATTRWLVIYLSVYINNSTFCGTSNRKLLHTKPWIMVRPAFSFSPRLTWTGNFGNEGHSCRICIN